MTDRNRFWRRWRVRFRRFRIAVHLLVLALICAVLWLNQIGLPDFLKKPLVEKLRERGVELQVVRLRWNFVHGLVADSVRVGGETPDSPVLLLQEVQLQLNFRALLRRKLQLDGIVLRQGKFLLPVSATNEPPRALTLDHIQSDLRFQTNDVWTLDNFQANFAGAKLILSGELAHASTVRDWEIFLGKRAVRGAAQAQSRKITDALSQIHFSGAAQLNLTVNGDARDLHSFWVRLGVSAPVADTPWGKARKIILTAHSTVIAPNAGGVAAPSLEIGWKAQLAQLQSENLNADFVFCGGFWRAPELAVTNLFARLGGGELRASARYNTATGQFSFTNSSCFDPHAVAAFLTEKTRARLDQFSWAQPPELRASGSLILPAWTNRAPDWRAEVQPTIRLDGALAITNATFNGLGLDKARAHFSYSNEIWTLPEIVITRSEGVLEITGGESDVTKDYHWRVRGALAPNFIEPFLTSSNAAREFHHLTFAAPLFLDGEIHGRLYDYDSISAAGHAALTNFSIRGETIDSVETDFRYANRVVEFFQPHLQAGAQTMHADGIRLDFPARIYFTNGLGTAYPQQVARAIGPTVGRVMQPYHFLQPPTVRVSGYAPLRDVSNADLDFEIVSGAALECLKLKTPDIAGEIHWLGQTLILTNVAGSFYGGSGVGHAIFDFRPRKGADFSFTADIKNVNVRLLATDMASPSNHLEGLLNGHFVVTSGNSENWRTCNGYGHAGLRDGLLREVPVFGILSPVLNAVSPGLGNIRATDASAQFAMTNGVIFTDALEIHMVIMQLQYAGSVDLQGRVNAHVTAELLRNVWGVGPLFSTVFWPVSKIFEYQVTGTLKNPKSQPVYIPKFLLFTLHPIRTLEGLFPGEAEPDATP